MIRRRTRPDTPQVSPGPSAPPAEIVVDARLVLARGEEPLDMILAAVDDALAAGADLVVYAPFEPTPLEALLGGMGFDYDAEALDGGDWRVRFTAAPAR